MIEKTHINEVVDFLFKENIPEIGTCISIYEQIFNKEYDKYSNKHVAEYEIMSEFKQRIKELYK